MKRLIAWIVAAIMALFLILGVTFSILRPSYVKEAVGILFSNELTDEDIAEENGIK